MDDMHPLTKDAEPEDTIALARSILRGIGIFPIEKRWSNPAEELYSVRIEDHKLPNISSNGKGVSPTMALASAYGEILERLQNRGSSVSRPTYGIMPDLGTKYFPDERHMEFSQMVKDQASVLQCLVDCPIADIQMPRDRALLAVPMVNVFERRIEYLPYEFLLEAVRSNGMCAGNTPEEALVQGLSEICERYVQREILTKGLSLPSITQPEIENSPAAALISNIDRNGYKVIVQDATLGGNFPVLCVVIIDPNTGSYKVRFGAHPSFDVALQRCLTEAFQGIESIDKELRSIEMNKALWREDPFRHLKNQAMRRIAPHVLCCMNGTVNLPADFFLSGGISRHRKAFQKQFQGNRTALKFIIAQLKKAGRSLFIRDVSVLGFPAYYTYVPGMSEIQRITQDQLSFLRERNTALNCIFRLGKATTKQIKYTADLLEGLFRTPTYYCFNLVERSWLRSFTSLSLKPKNDFNFLATNLDFLLANMFLCTGDLAKALSYLDIFLQANKNRIENISYFLCLRALLRLKTTGYNKNQIFRHLKNHHGEGLAREVIKDISKSREIFSLYSLPECGDCDHCPVKTECGYETWSHINRRFEDAVARSSIDQKDLLKRLAMIISK
jgi:ribosomal protein S12 methylthiotransferase accessory factor